MCYHRHRCRQRRLRKGYAHQLPPPQQQFPEYCSPVAVPSQRQVAVSAPVLAVAGLAVVFVNLIYSYAKKKVAAQNPWGVGATTLEWTVPSPPNFHTFDELPKFEDDQDTQKSHS